jgi:hypothetical protein
MPHLVQAGQGERGAADGAEREGLLHLLAGLLIDLIGLEPLVEGVDRDQRATRLERRPERRLLVHRLRAGVH